MKGLPAVTQTLEDDLDCERVCQDTRKEVLMHATTREGSQAQTTHMHHCDEIFLGPGQRIVQKGQQKGKIQRPKPRLKRRQGPDFGEVRTVPVLPSLSHCAADLQRGL